ncbi:hypothetical protein TTHERM_00299920 (macronuclear) [Tetrahymena thermophila SB210]|uniref:Uncharacterized protein n=1 Tax=Tetrahymena thermophila (strain SB210) TaxID=312017 RepID=I7LXA7_TETTS|nr:hypothetical protein TTHERM_00299920 [Tetrahymena thermophila SB210]EAS04274.2 hypothetical protein TTHERM_00299920 [Tetrahymena thermophila SB210]|eukprot:XP_001024519.2 hypothetical protein TTHERM_00299920 [Tetrahymena thermophila SB210]
MIDQNQEIQESNQSIQQLEAEKQDKKEEQITSKQFGLKLNKYFALGCSVSIIWYSYKIYDTSFKRSHLQKQLVYSPSIIQQSNKKLNEYLNNLTSQIKDFLSYTEEQNSLDSYQIYSKIKEKLQVLDAGLQKSMKTIDDSIQKYYQLDTQSEKEHIPITFIKENGQTTVRINSILVMGRLGQPENSQEFLLNADQSEYLIYKKNFKEKLFINNMLQSRQNPIHDVKEQWVNSFQLYDTQKDMKVLVNNFSSQTVITEDCLDHIYNLKDIMKLEKELGILFACSLLLSPFPFYNGIQIGVQDSELGIKARGIFCLLGDLVFDSKSQSFRMENPQFIARSKQAIIEYLNYNIKFYQGKLKMAIYGLALSGLIYYTLTHKQKVASVYQNIKQRIKKGLLYIYNNIL